MSNGYVIFLFLFLSCLLVLGQFEETCNNTVDGSSGICINIYQCQQYLLLVQLYIQNKDQNTANKLKHTKCGRDGNTIKVCCSNSPHENKVNSTVDPSNHHLRELPNPGFRGVSGARSFRKVVSGDPAKLEETCNNTVDGSSGICINIYRCQQYLLLVQLFIQNKDQNTANKLKHTKCGRDGNTIKVCCPKPGMPTEKSSTLPQFEPRIMVPVTESKNGDPADYYLRELPEPGLCGVSSGSFTRVVNGVPAKLGDFPWMALLGYRTVANVPKWNCGGSLISERHVLTAAHCIPRDENNLYIVRLGELDLLRDDDGATPLDVLIKMKIKHEEYNRTFTSVTNDIAILVLDRHIFFTDLIKPICLPQSTKLRRQNFDRYTPFVAGWGRTEFQGEAASHLQMVQIPVVSNAECKAKYERNKDNVVDERVLCAGFKRGGKDACQGDSGGPLMHPDLDFDTYYFYEIGIVSYGHRCAEPGFPGVYTRVTYFMPWITENVLGKST